MAVWPVSANSCAFASTRLMANFAQITDARIMMNGDEKKITRRFLFVIILTPRAVARSQSTLRAATLPTASTQSVFIPDIFYVRGLFFLFRAAAAFGATA
jgi:hypothetical protein